MIKFIVNMRSVCQFFNTRIFHDFTYKLSYKKESSYVQDLTKEKLESYRYADGD